MSAHPVPALAAAVVAVALGSPALAQPTLPNEFESVSGAFTPLSAYFGGVASFGAEVVPTTIHSGSSLRCWANFRRDNFFPLAGFTVGALDLAPPALSVPAGSPVFSVTVQTPDLQGKQLRLKVTLREDDNGDGVIDAGADDDEWEATEVLAAPGVRVINFPMAAFADTNVGIGNGVRNFQTTGRMTVNVTFETRRSMPGGIIEFPVSLLIDHAGFYAAAQTLPAPACPADHDGAGGLDVLDIFAFLEDWFAGSARADFDHAGGVDLLDIFAFLEAWFAGCP